MKVYIILHHEIFENGVDEMVFHIASSLNKAIEFIKKSYVSSYSWWEIQEQEMDDDEEWPAHVGYYGRRGGKLKTEPYKKAMEAFRQHRAEVSVNDKIVGHIDLGK